MVESIGCVPLRCRHGRVTYLAQYLCLFRVRLLETEVLEFALPSVPTKGCLSVIFYIVFYTFFQNTHWQYAPAWLTAKIFRRGRSGVLMEGFAAFTTQDTARWLFYYDYLVFMIEGSQNQNWNSINRPALWCSHLKWFSLHRCGFTGFICGISCLLYGVGTISCVVQKSGWYTADSPIWQLLEFILWQEPIS